MRKSKEGRSFAHRALGVEARRVPCTALARSVPWARCVPAVCRLFDARGAGGSRRLVVAPAATLVLQEKTGTFHIIQDVTAARVARPALREEINWARAVPKTGTAVPKMRTTVRNLRTPIARR